MYKLIGSAVIGVTVESFCFSGILQIQKNSENASIIQISSGYQLKKIYVKVTNVQAHRFNCYWGDHGDDLFRWGPVRTP